MLWWRPGQHRCSRDQWRQTVCVLLSRDGRTQGNLARSTHRCPQACSWFHFLISGLFAFGSSCAYTPIFEALSDKSCCSWKSDWAPRWCATLCTSGSVSQRKRTSQRWNGLCLSVFSCGVGCCQSWTIACPPLLSPPWRGLLWMRIWSMRSESHLQTKSSSTCSRSQPFWSWVSSLSAFASEPPL